MDVLISVNYRMAIFVLDSHLYAKLIVGIKQSLIKNVRMGIKSQEMDVQLIVSQ